MLMLERQKINRGFFLFKAQQKEKKEKIEKRQAKHKQVLHVEEIFPFSSDGNTTVTDEEAF